VRGLLAQVAAKRESKARARVRFCVEAGTQHAVLPANTKKARKLSSEIVQPQHYLVCAPRANSPPLHPASAHSRVVGIIPHNTPNRSIMWDHSTCTVVGFLVVKPNANILKRSIFMNRRQTYTAIVTFFALVVLANVANAQSKDQDNPTPLASNVISDTPSPDKNGEAHYYSFVANPGDVIITLTVEATKGVVQVGFTVFDENEVRLADSYATSGINPQAVEKIYVKRRQRIVLKVKTQNTTGFGQYRLRIGGDVVFGEKPTGGISGYDKTTTSTSAIKECLPKQGTLIIKMKDGSKKIIDLSEAETVTVVP